MIRPLLSARMLIRRLMIVLTVPLVVGGAARLYAAAATQPSCAPVAGAPISDFSAVEQSFLFDDDDENQKPAYSAASSQSSGRYFFNLLDNRSSYGKDFFHDPLIGPEFDSERQIELEYVHGENRGLQEDEVDAGFQWNVIGQLNIAVEFGWDSQHQSNFDGGGDDGEVERENATGFENVDLAVYQPVFQFVSKDGQLDYIAVGRFDVGIPTRTPASGADVQLTPYLGQLLRIGDHVSVEVWTGSQFTIAPGQTSQFIYGASFGYALSHDQLPVPLTQRITPILELDGQRPFSNGGQDALFGVVGIDIDFRSLGEMQPQIEIGYQIPIDAGAREQLRWGMVAQIFLEF
jgi:hypothetical protein